MKTVKQIADALGKPYQVVLRRVHALGIKTPKGKGKTRFIPESEERAINESFQA
jgi:hypothetical protein